MPQPAMTAYKRRTLDRANAVPPSVFSKRSRRWDRHRSTPRDTAGEKTGPAIIAGQNAMLKSLSPRDKGAAVELSWPQVRVLRRVAWPVHSSLVLQASRRLGDGDGALGCKLERPEQRPTTMTQCGVVKRTLGRSVDSRNGSSQLLRPPMTTGSQWEMARKWARGGCPKLVRARGPGGSGFPETSVPFSRGTTSRHYERAPCHLAASTSSGEEELSASCVGTMTGGCILRLRRDAAWEHRSIVDGHHVLDDAHDDDETKPPGHKDGVGALSGAQDARRTS
ncbi:hypothetical protein CMUS01_08522 [Colletotrichum musicola]|uniref:Uncharacterized protein n=1 Tax=Colletotrichum musicola TaxID=2175873 RepID=A0A8H6KBK7_9PEZI|nr:hypothetical protein CMUS01_08522 [Colletotrichum musicola]